MEKRKKEDNNILHYRRRLRINIGIIVFAFVLIYFLVYLIQYLTETHISVYEVQKGQIMVSSHYTGLALRSETVTYTLENGQINYYSKEGERAGYGDLICSIDSEGSISAEITAAGTDGSALTMNDLLNVQEIINDYSFDYSGGQFYNVYSFGDNLNSEVQENLYLEALERLESETNSPTFSLVTAQEDGILAFYTDGYEDVTPESFTPDLYQASDYKKENLKGNTSVTVGQALYKTVTEENWYMMVPISEDASEMYASRMEEGEDSFTILVTFKKDEAQSYANAEILSYGDQDFLKLTFNSSMVRYVSDRYLEVELGSGDNAGLKIPNSAITQKEFLVVPERYITNGNNSTGKGVIRVDSDKQSDPQEEFITADIYYIDEETGNYCISAEGLSPGDTIQAPDSSSRYTLEDTVLHDGVYNLNKGYAVFKLIDTISSHGEYSIVETGTSYGLAMYDRIALNGDAIVEGEYTN